MPLVPGTRLGPYEVLASLGAGGMSEVYRARDSRLHREVAIKVVGEGLAGDTGFLSRLEQEARLAGSLNHPNIVAVHDIGVHEGAPYVVTELLQGETLRERLARGPVPLCQALEWAGQMAHALAAAHARGIVHRDLKPENVFITRTGQVKLLDFGIAKATPQVTEPRGLLDPTMSPAGSATRTGAVLGTPGYMSPEQVRGEHADARSDIFALGIILHELLSGQRAFRAGSIVESGYSILHDEPAPLAALRSAGQWPRSSSTVWPRTPSSASSRRATWPSASRPSAGRTRPRRPTRSRRRQRAHGVGCCALGWPALGRSWPGRVRRWSCAPVISRTARAPADHVPSRGGLRRPASRRTGRRCTSARPERGRRPSHVHHHLDSRIVRGLGHRGGTAPLRVRNRRPRGDPPTSPVPLPFGLGGRWPSVPQLGAAPRGSSPPTCSTPTGRRTV